LQILNPKKGNAVVTRVHFALTIHTPARQPEKLVPDLSRTYNE
jgi:hypothetical protein